MRLLVIRHSEAVARSEAQPDPERALTDKGRRDARALARALSALGVTLDCLHHSPWLRAVETADALVGLVRRETFVTERLAMPPGQELLKALSGDSVAVVGHQPWLGVLTSWLLLGDRENEGAGLDLAKARVPAK